MSEWEWPNKLQEEAARASLEAGPEYKMFMAANGIEIIVDCEMFEDAAQDGGSSLGRLIDDGAMKTVSTPPGWMLVGLMNPDTGKKIYGFADFSNL